uniref:Uncharacterized protein n=1 Tax=Strongyloides venezuelensis TaxID=75913 RepID=A0A0K0FSW5_STRVS
MNNCTAGPGICLSSHLHHHFWIDWVLLGLNMPNNFSNVELIGERTEIPSLVESDQTVTPSRSPGSHQGPG